MSSPEELRKFRSTNMGIVIIHSQYCTPLDKTSDRLSYFIKEKPCIHIYYCLLRFHHHLRANQKAVQQHVFCLRVLHFKIEK